ncbi:MAG: hypothetical protein HYR85_07860 [Planctomycetes bacterium]|nr:hypothetical protein [Planctomycetota bacterium]
MHTSGPIFFIRMLSSVALIVVAAGPRAWAGGSRVAPAAGGEITFAGRVVDERRFPTRDAAVRIALLGLPIREATTGADGRFEIPVGIPDATRSREGSVRAVTPDGRVAEQSCCLYSVQVRRNWPPQAQRTHEDLGVLVVHPSHSLRVAVKRGDERVPHAIVRVEWSGKRLYLSDDRVLVGECEADENGLAIIEHVPDGDVAVIALAGSERGRVNASVPAACANPVEIALQPTWDMSVEVLDGASGGPLDGAHVAVLEETRDDGVRRPIGGFGASHLSARDLLLDLPATTADGKWRVTGLGRDQKIVVRATKEGCKAFADGMYVTDCPVDSVDAEADVEHPLAQIRLYPVPRRLTEREFVVEHVECGRGATDGPVTLRRGSAVGASPENARATLRGKKLVCTALDPHVGYTVVAPDGCLARLPTGPESDVTFRRPRSVDVTVLDPKGSAVPDVLVTLTVPPYGYAELTAPTPTDSKGHVQIAGLYPQNVQVQLSRSANSSSSVIAGTLDLESGDGRLSCCMPESRDLLVRVRLNGKPGLPGEFDLRVADRGSPVVLSEDPEKGELRCRIDGKAPGASATLTLTAAGFVTQGKSLLVAAGPSPSTVDFDLQSRGTLRLHVVPPQDGEMKLVLLIRDPDLPFVTPWDLDYFKERTSVLRDGTISVSVNDLKPGEYRLRDDHSGLTSEAGTIAPSRPTPELSLDLSRCAWIAGRVEVPEGQPRDGIVILAKRDDEASRDWFTGYAQVATTSEGGVFRVRAALGKSTVVRPFHPRLRPAREGGTATLSGDSPSDLVLRMESGDTLSFRATPPTEVARRLGSMELMLFRGEPGRDFAFRQGASATSESVVTFGGFDSGTYTIWLDPNFLAPVRLDGVELRDGETNLGEIAFSSGTSIRVTANVKDGQPSPILSVEAMSTSWPRYGRHRMGEPGAKEIVLSGLAAGSFEVTVRRGAGREVLLSRIVDVDGRNEMTLDVDVP